MVLLPSLRYEGSALTRFNPLFVLLGGTVTRNMSMALTREQRALFWRLPVLEGKVLTSLISWSRENQTNLSKTKQAEWVQGLQPKRGGCPTTRLCVMRALSGPPVRRHLPPHSPRALCNSPENVSAWPNNCAIT